MPHFHAMLNESDGSWRGQNGSYNPAGMCEILPVDRNRCLKKAGGKVYGQCKGRHMEVGGQGIFYRQPPASNTNTH
ncbi:hypothetical protein FOYG_17618 [Fusarium oxysporum NRRL 32931]|uniref:Uncharacterized protein n=1 Tax=Fusarium oxysporum NRRL 32931 TaxID=660029 RepID=W9HG77_FUSOX|nr:hypothetical protein FOYG_17618 [Fusarium oxysporum NRRL 32931]